MHSVLCSSTSPSQIRLWCVSSCGRAVESGREDGRPGAAPPSTARLGLLESALGDSGESSKATHELSWESSQMLLVMRVALALDGCSLPSATRFSPAPCSCPPYPHPHSTHTLSIWPSVRPCLAPISRGEARPELISSLLSSSYNNRCSLRELLRRTSCSSSCPYRSATFLRLVESEN